MARDIKIKISSGFDPSGVSAASAARFAIVQISNQANPGRFAAALEERLCHSSDFKPSSSPPAETVHMTLSHNLKFQHKHDYQNCICAGIFSGKTGFAGRPKIEYARSHCARVTKIARTAPSGGTFNSKRRKCVCWREKVTQGLA